MTALLLMNAFEIGLFPIQSRKTESDGIIFKIYSEEIFAKKVAYRWRLLSNFLDYLS